MFYQFSHHGSGDYFVKEYRENFSFPLHLHLCFEFITVLSGEMKITVDTNEYTLHKGEALLIFPNQLHSLQSENSSHMLCIFSPVLVQAYSSKREKYIPESNFFVPDSYLIDALDNLPEESKSFYKKGVLYSICSQFDSVAKYISKDMARSDLLSKIFEFVEESYDKNCSLGDLSRSIGYDYAYLSRYFKKSTGMSFIEYLNQYRLNNACSLLEDSDLPILECALSSGYTSLRSFNRNFKNRYLITPQEYRMKSKKQS
ncbi:MAG: AraC family transcriptional regulator [Ruminococcaceae bacterium]|nr:AraC family transcriptional regulator [Oscillospiraceae bacterium]